MPAEWYTLRASAEGVVLLDQSRLPNEEIYRTCTTVEEVAVAIEDLVVRGAPAIACAAALAVALAARSSEAASVDGLVAEVEAAVERLALTRPTAVNLFWAFDRMRGRLNDAAADGDVEAVRDAIWRNMKVTPWRRGDVLVIDNHSTSHGRLPYSGPRKIAAAWS